MFMMSKNAPCHSCLQSILLYRMYCSLTHWGRVMHICVSKISIIGSDNGLSPGRSQAIMWTSGGILLIGPSGLNLCEILIEIYTFSFKKMHLKMSSGKWRPFCLGLKVLTLLVLKLEYFGNSKSIPWLLMPWLFVSPSHQQQWCWLYSINRVIVVHQKGMVVSVPAHLNVEKW